MHRFYLPPSEWRKPALALTGREAHHAIDVLRIRVGDTLTVMDGQGLVCLCQAAAAARDQLTLHIVDQRSAPPLPYKVTLAQAIPKGKLFEDIVEKATELGVGQIVPLVTERVVARPSGGDVLHKVEKWRQAAIEAIKQCGSPWLPEIQAPMTVEQFLPVMAQNELALVGSLAGGSRHPRSFFDQFALRQGKLPTSISVAIGPEGDLTPKELAALQTAGACPITLGPLVLRTETAAIYCLSIINYELQARLSFPAKSE